MAKYYAIKEGYDKSKNVTIKNLILTDWNEAKNYVFGVGNAIFKSFTNEADAEAYLNIANNASMKDDGVYPTDCPHFYVDGSYNDDAKAAGFGVVCVVNDKVEYFDSGKYTGKEFISSRQIAGELSASLKSIKLAIEMKMPKIVLFYDYAGIRFHATREQDRDSDVSKAYGEEYDRITANSQIEIHFCKVNAHTGDIFNEIADGLAKEAIEMVIPAKTLALMKQYGVSTMIKHKDTLKNESNPIHSELPKLSERELAFELMDLSVQYKNTLDREILKKISMLCTIHL